MHVEPLEKLPRSVREFLSHYAMIVLSILTALALEQAALGLEHAHEGARARAEIEQEITANRAAIVDALKQTHDNARLWEGLLQRTVADVKAGESTNERRLDTLGEALRQFRDSLPTLKTTAWESAIANHAVDYLDHRDLTRYSEIYSTQRLFTQAMWDTLRDGALRNITDMSLATALGKSDATQTLAVLGWRTRTLSLLESDLLQLDQVMKPPASGH